VFFICGFIVVVVVVVVVVVDVVLNVFICDLFNVLSVPI
jgi:hypothetical protein